MSTGATSAGEVQRGAGLLAVAFSDGRRTDARLVSGEHRSFGLNTARTVVKVPHPYPAPGWNARTLTCGIALQCAPSKDRIAEFELDDLSPRERAALSIAESRVALGWMADRWGGLLVECRRVLGGLDLADPDLEPEAILTEAMRLARSNATLSPDPLLGRLPPGGRGRRSLSTVVRQAYGRMPWSSKQHMPRRIHSTPVGGDGGVRNSNPPPPSRPVDDDLDYGPNERLGIPYPEWNMWSGQFLQDHVAVLERASGSRSKALTKAPPEVRRWFEEHTHRVIRNGLEDGSDLDISRYVDHYVDRASGVPSEPLVFRDLVPGFRDVTTAVLLDGSSSLGVNQGQIFNLELTCADWLSQAMTAARERHGIFVFSGNTRHRVELSCLKDFNEPRFVAPSGLGLVTGGYTRLGAPIRHLTSRLLGQASERRLLIIIGDGLMCDEGYEGRYAWADVAHAVEEAEEAGLAIFYIGVGVTRVDPLPEVFGPRRSQRIRRIEELPRVLAQVHRELVAS